MKIKSQRNSKGQGWGGDGRGTEGAGIRREEGEKEG